MNRIRIGAGAQRVHELDWLMLAVVALCCFGLTMAVSVQSLAVNSSALHALESQGAKLVAGLAMLIVCSLMPIEWLRRNAAPLFLMGLVGVVVACLFSDAKGAHRWIKIGSFSFQPVEFARLGLILLTSAWIAAVGERKREFFAGFLRVMAPTVVLAALLALQPDLGNAFLCLALTSAMAIAAGVSIRWFVIAALPMIPLLAIAVLVRGYAVGRITSYLSDEPPYQVQQSITAISSGGLSGAGLGNGWMKLGFVPEAQNDFVFAVIGEELGLIGCLVVLGLYSIIGGVGFRLARTMRDPFYRYIVLGCSLAICMQALVNLLVTTGLAPAKGIDLPLVSSGGTNLMAMLGAVGLIGNAARADRVYGHGS